MDNLRRGVKDKQVARDIIVKPASVSLSDIADAYARGESER
jgi:hypothetical protein